MGGTLITLENRTERVITVRVAVVYLSSSGQPLRTPSSGKKDRIRLQMRPHHRWVVSSHLFGRPSSDHNMVAILLARAQGQDHMKDFGFSHRLSSYSVLFFDMDAHGGGLTLSGIPKPRFRPFDCMMISNHVDEEGKDTLISRGSICSVHAYPFTETFANKPR